MSGKVVCKGSNTGVRLLRPLKNLGRRSAHETWNGTAAKGTAIWSPYLACSTPQGRRFVSCCLEDSSNPREQGNKLRYTVINDNGFSGVRQWSIPRLGSPFQLDTFSGVRSLVKVYKKISLAENRPGCVKFGNLRVSNYGNSHCAAAQGFQSDKQLNHLSPIIPLNGLKFRALAQLKPLFKATFACYRLRLTPLTRKNSYLIWSQFSAGT